MLLLCAPLGSETFAQRGRFDSGSTSVEARSRLLFVWDANTVYDAKAREDIFRFARKRRIDTLMVESSPLGYSIPGALPAYKKFVFTAHRLGIRVFALSGYPWFTVSPDAGLPGQPTSYLEAWSLYETIAASGIPFDGIADDSAPYLTHYTDAGGNPRNYFWENLPQSAQDYLDFLHGTKKRIGKMPFYHSIPYWLDSDPRLELALDGDADPRPLNEYVSEQIDSAFVLAYRDRAMGRHGILSLSLGEIQDGPCVIGVETSDLGEELDHVTFFEEGRFRMETQLLITRFVLGRHKNFRGLAIHHYGSYATMKR